MSSSEHTLRILATVQNDVRNGVNSIRSDIRGLGDDVRKTAADQKQFLNEGISLWAAYHTVLNGVRFAWSAVEEKAKWDQLTASLNVMEGGAKEGAASLERLIEIAKLPGIGLEEAQTAYLRLRSLKISGDEATHMMVQLSNAIALAGGGAEEFNRVGVQMAQILGKSSVMQQDLNVIAESMPMIRTLMQDTFGATTAEGIRDLNISNREFIDGLIEAMETLPRAQDNLKNTIEKVGTSWSLFKASFVDRSFTMEVLNAWGDMLDEMTKLLEGKAKMDWPGAMKAFLTGGFAGVGGFIAGGGNEQAAIDAETEKMQRLVERRGELRARGLSGNMDENKAAADEIKRIDAYFEGRRLAQGIDRDNADFRAKFASLNVAPAVPKQKSEQELDKERKEAEKAYRLAQKDSDERVRVFNEQNPTFKEDEIMRRFELKKSYENMGEKNPNIGGRGYTGEMFQGEDGTMSEGYQVELSDEYLEEYKKKNNELIKVQAQRGAEYEKMLDEMEEAERKHNEEVLRDQIRYADKYSGLLEGTFTQIWSNVRKDGMSTWDAIYDGFSEMITKMVIQWLARAAVFAAMTAITGGGAGTLGGFSSYVFGARAGGGPTYPGETVIKNERYGSGELFKPATAGSIEPNYREGGGGGGTTIHIHGSATYEDARRVRTALADSERGRLTAVVEGW